MTNSAALATKPDHKITITPYFGRVVVTFKGAVVADTERALQLNEGPYGPVLYIARSDCKMEHFIETEHQTICPFKGEARYWSLSSKDGVAMNAVWAYDNPLPVAADIRNLVAFYPDKVDIRAGGA